MSKIEKAIESQRRIVQRMSDEVGSISLAVNEGTINAKLLERRLLDVQERLGSCSDGMAEMVQQMRKGATDGK